MHDAVSHARLRLRQSGFWTALRPGTRILYSLWVRVAVLGARIAPKKTSQPAGRLRRDIKGGALGWLVTITTTLAVALADGPTLDAQGGPPLAPALMQSSVGTRASFAWVPDAQGPAPTGYLLQAGSGPGLSNLAVISLPGNQTSFAADAPPGVYYVRVIAVNAAGTSGKSNELVVTLTSSCTAPGP